MAYKIKDENGNVFKVNDKEVFATDFDIEVKQPDGGDGRRVISMIGSTPSIDRDNDIIVQSGWDTKAFKKSSPVLWSHDHKIPAIAKVTKFNKSKDALTFDEIEFPEKGIHALSDMVFELIQGGFIKAGSVGFLPIKSERRERTEEEEKNEPQSFCPPTTFIKQELLEFSIVNVGSNRDAIVTHLGEKGFNTTGKIKLPTENGEEVEVDVMDVLNKLLVQDKRVIPHKKYPLDPEGAAWNGPKERSAASVEVLRLISTWFDAEKPDVKSSYKLPHHRAEGHNTVLRGVRAAMSALLGARGGVDIPEGDRRGIHRHLGTHLREFSKPVPELRVYEETELKEIFPEIYSEDDLIETLLINSVRDKLSNISENSCIRQKVNFLLESGDIKESILIYETSEGLVAHLNRYFDQSKIIEVELVVMPTNEIDPPLQTHSDGDNETVVPVIPPDFSMGAEILRLKDGGFLFDFTPTKEMKEKNTRFNVTFLSTTERCGEAILQSYDEDEKTWKDIQTISIQDIEQKAGAVLNKTNKKRLKDAQLLIGEVLSESEPADLADKNEPDITTEPPDDIKALIETVKALTEKVESLETKAEEDSDDADIDISNIETPKKDQVDLSAIGDFMKNNLPGIMKSVVDERFNKALGKV